MLLPGLFEFLVLLSPWGSLTHGSVAVLCRPSPSIFWVSSAWPTQDLHLLSSTSIFPCPRHSTIHMVMAHTTANRWFILTFLCHSFAFIFSSSPDWFHLSSFSLDFHTQRTHGHYHCTLLYSQSCFLLFLFLFLLILYVYFEYCHHWHLRHFYMATRALSRSSLPLSPLSIPMPPSLCPEIFPIFTRSLVA